MGSSMKRIAGALLAACGIVAMILTIGLPNQRVSGGATQPGTATLVESSVCTSNSGDNVTAVSFGVPVATKTYADLPLRYTSSTGWDVFTPRITKTSGGTWFYNNGSCLEPLTHKTNGTFETRHGYGIFALSTDQSVITIYSKTDGGTERYEALPANPDGTVNYKLVKVANRTGWQSTYIWNTNAKLTEVRIDGRENAPHQFAVKLNRVSGVLNTVEVLGKSGAVVKTYSLLWEGPKLKKVTLLNSSGSEAKATDLDYNADGLLWKITDRPLGGETEFAYLNTTITPPSGQSGTPFNKFILRQITVRAKAGAAAETTDLGFLDPIFNNGKFDGFSVVKSTDSTGRTYEERYGSGVFGGLVNTATVTNSTGAPISITYSEYSQLGGHVKLQSTSTEYHSSSGYNLYRSSNIYDAEGRPEGVLSENQVGSGGSFTDDDSVTSIEYETLPNEPLRWAPKKIAVHYGNGSSLRESNFTYYPNGNLHVASYVSEDGAASQETYTYDDFGNTRSVAVDNQLTSTLNYSLNGYLLESSEVRDSGGTLVSAYGYGYNPSNGLLETVVDMNGVTATVERDSNLRFKKITVAKDSISRQLMEVAYSLAGSTDTSSNNLVSAVYLNGSETGSAIDGFGNSAKSWLKRLDGTYLASANVTENDGEVLKAYPSFVSATQGFNTAELSGKFHYTTTLDSAGRVASIQPSITTGPGLTGVSLTYGDVPSPLSFPNPESMSLHIPGQATVSVSNWINTTTSAVSDGQENITFKVTNEGNRSVFKDGANNSFTTQIDGENHLTSAEIPGDTDIVASHNETARSSTVTDSAGRTVTTFTNEDGTPTRVIFGAQDDPAAETHFYTYDAAKRLHTVTGPYDSVEFTYSPLGELTEIIHRDLDTGETYNCGFKYNVKNQLEQIDFPTNQAGGSVTANYEYDLVGNLVRIYSPNIMATDTTLVRYNEWDKFYAPLEMTYPQFGLAERVIRSPELGFTTLREIKRTTGEVLANTLYDWNNLGQLRSETTNNSLGQSVLTYTYDSFGRMHTSVTTNNGTSIQKTFNYDHISRVESVEDTSVGTYNFAYTPADPYQAANFSINDAPYSNIYSNQELREVYLNTVKKLGVDYTPGGAVSSIATINNQQYFGSAEFIRSVFGNLLKITFRDHSQSVVKVERNYCNGIYQVISDANGTTGIANIPGQRSDGSGPFAYALTFNQQSGTQGLQGPATGEPGTPTPAPRPRVPSACGNGQINQGETCDGAARSPACEPLSDCSGCQCQLRRTPQNQTPFISGYQIGSAGNLVPNSPDDSAPSGTSSNSGTSVSYGPNGFTISGPCQDTKYDARTTQELQRTGHLDNNGNWIGPVMKAPTSMLAQGLRLAQLPGPIANAIIANNLKTWWQAGDGSELPDDGNRVHQGMTILTMLAPADAVSAGVSILATKFAASTIGKGILNWLGSRIARGSNSMQTGAERICKSIYEAINPANKTGSSIGTGPVAGSTGIGGVSAGSTGTGTYVHPLLTKITPCDDLPQMTTPKWVYRGGDARNPLIVFTEGLKARGNHIEGDVIDSLMTHAEFNTGVNGTGSPWISTTQDLVTAKRFASIGTDMHVPGYGMVKGSDKSMTGMSYVCHIEVNPSDPRWFSTDNLSRFDEQEIVALYEIPSELIKRIDVHTKEGWVLSLFKPGYSPSIK